MTANKNYVPFSQRAGLEPIPDQLKLGEVSEELRRLISYYIDLEIERNERYTINCTVFNEKWKRVASDFHIFFLKKDLKTFNNYSKYFEDLFRRFARDYNFEKLFDFVEFLVRNPHCSDEMKNDLAGSFIQARAAYRIIDGIIVAIGVGEQAIAYERALTEAEAKDAGAAKKHLVSAGNALRQSDWSGSVRESIHAVEAMARRLAPNEPTLGKALAFLEQRGHLHGSLKNAFSALYGYSSDEAGVRHALVFKGEAQVDEADALFMLGACASFVSHLLAREAKSPNRDED